VRLEPAVRAVARPGDGAGDARRDAAAGGVQVGEVLLDVRPEVLLDARDAGHPQAGRGGRPAGDFAEELTADERRWTQIKRRAQEFLERRAAGEITEFSGGSRPRGRPHCISYLRLSAFICG